MHYRVIFRKKKKQGEKGIRVCIIFNIIGGFSIFGCFER